MLFRKKSKRSVSDALKAVKDYNINGMAVSLRYNGKCTSKRDNIRATLIYLGLLDKIRNSNLNASILVDHDKIGSKFDERFFMSNQARILRKAHKYKIKVDFDNDTISDLRIAKKVLKGGNTYYLNGSDGRFVYNIHRYVNRNKISKKKFEFWVSEKDKIDRHFVNYNVRVLYNFG